MTDTEVRDIVADVFDKLQITYNAAFRSNDFIPPGYLEKHKCPDGEIRDVYEISVRTPYTGTMEPRTFYVIIDASTKKVLFIMGSLSFRVVLYHEDGTITTEPGKLKL
jgi:hypothetical protein